LLCLQSRNHAPAARTPPPGRTPITSEDNAQDGAGRVYNFSREQVADLFTGLDLVPPGIVPAPTWRPEWPHTAPGTRAAMILPGVGQRK
jgi:hypothetical protein